MLDLNLVGVIIIKMIIDWKDIAGILKMHYVMIQTIWSIFKVIWKTSS